MNYVIDEKIENKKIDFVKVLIYFYFILAFFEPYLNGVVGSITKYFLIFLICLIFITRYKEMCISKLHIYFIFWIFYKIISLLWTTDYSIAELHFASQIGMIGLLLVLMSMKFTKKDVNIIINVELIGSTIIGALSILFAKSYHNELESRQVLVLFGVENDPNNLAAFLCIGSVIAFYKLLKNSKNKLIYLFMFIINVFSCLNTGSRTGLITLIVINILVFLLCNSNRTFWSKIKILFFTLIAVFAIMYIIKTSLSEKVFERLFDFETYEGGSERINIWSKVFGLCKEDLNIIFGAGWGAYHGYKGMYVSVHNTFLSMLCDVGLIGLLAFLIPIIKCSIDFIKNKYYFPIIIILASFIPSFFIEAINKRFFWNAIMLFFIIYNVYIKNGKNDIKQDNII